ncbi:MAG: hypothetical protein JXA10_03580 [Anaerolineae bacterium]|nr:hypothetical protein [Anaerolineae bacterium]
MSEKVKYNKPAYYTVDFTTALPLRDCRQRLERSAKQTLASGSALAPITQRIVFLKNDQFIIERTFPGAVQPIRLTGALDDAPNAGSGTWVHGAITHDTENQVLIEGLIVFLSFFLLTILFFLRLRTRVFLISLPALVVALTILSLRWRALRATTLDLSLWMRRRLYVTPDQVRQDSSGSGARNGAQSRAYSSMGDQTDDHPGHQPDDQSRTYRHGSNGH